MKNKFLLLFCILLMPPVFSSSPSKQDFSKCKFGEFENGTAVVLFEKWWGIINSEGEFIVKSKDEFGCDENLKISNFPERIYIGKRFQFGDRSKLFKFGKEFIRKKRKIFLVTRLGEICNNIGFDNAESYNGKNFTAINIKGKWGFISESGKVVIKPQFEDAHNFTKDGLAQVKIDGKWGFINESGRIVIKTQFENVESFNDAGFAYIKKGDKLGLIDRKGNMIAKPEFDEISKFKDGMAKVKVQGKYNFISDKGELLPNSSFFDYAFNFSEGFAPVELEKKWGYIDKKGNWLVEPKYENATVFCNGYASVLKNGKYGVIDKSGELIIPFIHEKGGFLFEGIYFKKCGLAIAKKNGKYGVIDTKGKPIIDFNYEVGEIYDDEKFIYMEKFSPYERLFFDFNGKQIPCPLKFEENVSLKKLNITKKRTRNSQGKNRLEIGYDNEKGELVIDYKFIDAGDFSEGLAYAKTEDKVGYINEKGDFVLVYDFKNGKFKKIE